MSIAITQKNYLLILIYNVSSVGNHNEISCKNWLRMSWS